MTDRPYIPFADFKQAVEEILTRHPEIPYQPHLCELVGSHELSRF